MLVIYLLENILFFTLGLATFKRIFNPLTIFLVPWSLMVVLYEMKLVDYSNLSLLTYCVLLINTLVFCISCLLGFKSNIDLSVRLKEKIIDRNTFKLKFKRLIILLTAIGIIPAIVSLIDVIRIYGIRFYTMLSVIYGERVSEKINIATIPYLTSLVFIAITLAGIYYYKYGFEKFIIFPILSICIQPFTNGGRQFLVEGIILFLLPSIIGGKAQKKLSISVKIVLSLFTIAMLLLLLSISNQRSAYVSDISYTTFASPLLSKVMGIMPGIYQVYTYFSSPVGVLNAFLNTPSFSFGINSLFPIYGFLNLFGANIPVQRYQQFYFVPIQANVGTAVKELIEDYHLFFAFFVIFICGLIVGKSFKNFENKNNFENLYILSLLYMLVFFSSFSWMLRDANLIIALILGMIICKYLDSFNVEIGNHE